MEYQYCIIIIGINTKKIGSYNRIDIDIIIIDNSKYFICFFFRKLKKYT